MMIKSLMIYCKIVAEDFLNTWKLQTGRFLKDQTGISCLSAVNISVFSAVVLTILICNAELCNVLRRVWYLERDMSWQTWLTFLPAPSSSCRAPLVIDLVWTQINFCVKSQEPRAWIMLVKNKQILCYNYQQSNSSLALFTINTLLTDTADWSMCGECGVQMVDNEEEEEEEEGYHWDSGTRAVWILSNQPTPVLFPPINTNTHSGEINTTRHLI